MRLRDAEETTGMAGTVTSIHRRGPEVQRREFQAGELVWIHDITLERTRATKLQFPWFGPVLITIVGLSAGWIRM